MYRDHTIAAVVPAYNESGFVGDVIDGLPPFLDRAYVVDDGSTDDTWSEITRHADDRNDRHEGRFEELVVPIQHDHNRGVGGAIKTGYQRARDEAIDVTVVLGGDDQMDPGELTRYIDPIVDGVADYTKGNRFARPEDRAEMPRFRLFGNVVLSYLTKIASGYWESMDSQNGYTAISLSALERTDIDGMYEYYGYCNDLLVRLNVANVRIADVPRSSEYAYTEGWKSHIDYKEYIPHVSAMLFRSFRWRLKEKYLLESYNPLALLYPLGIGALAGGVAGFVNAVRTRRGDSGSWFLTVLLGALLVIYAGIRDMADNEHLERSVETDQDTTETATDSSRPATPAASDGLAEGVPASRQQREAQPDGGTDGSDDRAGGPRQNGASDE
ncbi:glycosyltransferase [Haloarcula sp. GH36]|uniref:glycosyltransferase n=1 Tax=Haloarcula montana TaxID=3111776 RepID=UPI002D798495|nr:glycosyltransferase [Haloarcula sp. GH36]